MIPPLALIAGSGGVLGEALAREFAGAGYTVAGLRRGGEAQGAGASPSSTPSAMPSALACVASCDLADPTATAHAVATLVARHGPVEVLLYNAGHLAVAPFLELDDAAFDACWQAGPAGAARCARAVLPAMLARGGGCMIFTGATASLRGSARFAAMAAAKSGLRALAQSLAREFQPRGIHVAHVLLDGLLHGSVPAQRFGGGDTQRALDPQAVAAAYRWLAGQPRAAWTHELDLRTMLETF